MTAASSSPGSPQSGATAAFIKGIERRALAVAELQSGDPTRAALAVSAAIRVFLAQSDGVPMANWPPLFWNHLCSSPALRQPASDARWPASVQALSGIIPASRLALLLRVGAGLEEDAAAQALQIDTQSYRAALADACPRDASGQPDATAWRHLAEAVQQALRDLPAARLAALSAAATATPSAPRGPAPTLPSGWVVPERDRPTAQQTSPRARPARAGTPAWQWVLMVLGIAVLLAAGWRWYAQRGPALPEAAVQQEGTLQTDNPVLTEALGDTPPPPSAGEDMHATSDAAMLADPQLALAREADLLAWLAAGGPMPVDESEMQPSTPPAAGEPLETTEDGNE